MSTDDDADLRRVKYYGPNDFATRWFAERAAELVLGFEASGVDDVNDAIELHNAQLFYRDGFVPSTWDAAEAAKAADSISMINAAVGRFFNGLDDENLAERVAGVGFEYQDDLLTMLGRSGAYARCAPAVVVRVLSEAGLHLATMMSNRSLVVACDHDLRNLLMSDPRYGEILVRKYLLDSDSRVELYLPRSLTPDDSRDLIGRYLDSERPNLNFVHLVATAPLLPQAGINAQLKLRAKRRSDALSAELFQEGSGWRTGVELAISADQISPVEKVFGSDDEIVMSSTYGESWLLETLDFPSVLNNFQHLFEFVDDHALLSLPAYPSELGVMERVITTSGRSSYKTGVAFRMTDLATKLQTRMYRDFLAKHSIDLEGVIAWFFNDYLAKDFKMENFDFQPSDDGSSYLQRARHLFVEMESIARQFALFVETGELDRELLAIASEQVRYPSLPSLVEGKYVYPLDHPDLTTALHLLFSDQSPLTYMNEHMKAHDGLSLFVQHEVAYSDLADHQKPNVDFLVEHGLLEVENGRVVPADFAGLVVIRRVWGKGVVNYRWLKGEERARVDDMVEAGWLTRRSSLLTEPEASYFNYFLNQSEFSNGPDLRNKYLHGSQTNEFGEDSHFEAFIIALRMIVALVIKINDDVCLCASGDGNGRNGGVAHTTGDLQSVRDFGH